MIKGVIRKSLYFVVPFLTGLSLWLFSFDALADQSCISYKERMARMMAQCWVCDFTAILLKAINTVVTDGYNILSGGHGSAISILAIGLALWLAWQVGNYFINYKYSDPMELLTQMGHCCFRAMIIAVVLSVGTVSFVFDDFIYPVVSAFMDVIMLIVGLDLDSVDFGSATDYCQIAKNPESVEESGKVFSTQLISSMVCMVQAIYFETLKGVAMGLGINCYSNGRLEIVFLKLPDFSMWALGALIFMIFFVVSIVFSFKVVDFFMHMAFAFVLLPLLLVAWVFPITRQYAQKAWDLFLYSLFGLLALAMTMPIILTMCGGVLGVSDRIDDYLNQDNMYDLYLYIYKAGTNWLLFLAVGFISYLLCTTSTAIAQHFVQVQGDVAKNVGDSVGADMAKASLQAVQSAVRLGKLTLAMTGVGAVASGAMTAAKEGAKTAVKKVAKTAKNAATSAGKGAAKAAVNAGKKAARRVNYKAKK